jgi:hypothetical protein
MQSCFVQGQLVHRGPQVQGIALGAALGVEALEGVLAQMRRERRLGIIRAAVERTGPAALQAAAAQLVEQAQLTQDLLHADLLAEEREVHFGPSGPVWLRRRLLNQNRNVRS